MSSVLHPVGPEPRERYWVRRVAVLVAAVVAIGVVIALIGNAMSAGSAVQAEPAAPTSLPPTVPLTPSASPTPSDTASPTPSGSPSTPVPTPAAGSTPTGSPSPSPSSSSAKPDQKTDSKKTEKTSKKKVVEQPTYSACDPDDLRPTLTGDKTVKTGAKTDLSLSLVNGSKKTCTVKVNPAKVTVTIVSGSDRIWSTKDCPAAMPGRQRTLLPDHALGWTVTWDGKRSGADCKSEKAKPKKGYYWAIASVEGSGTVRSRLVLT